MIKSRMRQVGHVPHKMMRNAYKILVVNPEVRRPLGRPRCRWEDIKMDIRDTELRCGLD
jgi:predicted CoA-binding protein